MMDDEVHRELTKKQAKGIVYINGNYSFSKCVNDTLRAGLRK